MTPKLDLANFKVILLQKTKLWSVQIADSVLITAELIIKTLNGKYKEDRVKINLGNYGNFCIAKISIQINCLCQEILDIKGFSL